MALEEGSPIEPGLVRFDPLLNLRAVPSLEDGKSHELLQMVQIDPDYEVKEALRGAGMVKLLSGSPGAPFHLLPVRHVISAVLATSDTELPLARFVMPY
jgi:acetoacetate decarboxylase